MNQSDSLPAPAAHAGTEMYDDDEVESFREQFEHFSEKELELAILQARKDILEELEDYQIIEVQKLKVTKENDGSKIKYSRDCGWPRRP